MPSLALLGLLALAAAGAASYLANDSLIGRALTCTEAEKECFRYNRLLYKRHCYPLGHGPKGCPLFVDKQELEEGRLRGKCMRRKQCPGSEDDFRMAYDGRCLRYRDVVKICSGAANLEVSSHFFGGAECVRADWSAPPPAYVAQPAERGACLFPNLRHDMTSVRAVEARHLGLKCDAAQSACFARGQVWLAPLRACVHLLRQGPCADGQRVVLRLSERSGATATTVAAECAAVNPCRPDQRLLAFDGRCHDISKVRTVLCPSGLLLPNAYGQLSCSGVKDMYKHVVLLESHRAEACEVAHRVSHSLGGPGVRVAPDCSLTDPGQCAQAVNDLLRAHASPNDVPVPY